MNVQTSRALTLNVDNAVVVAHIPANINDVTAESIGQNILTKVQKDKESHYQQFAKDDYPIVDSVKALLEAERFRVIVATGD